MDYPIIAFEKWQKKASSENSWIVPVEEIMAKNYDLSAKNPNDKGDIEHKSPAEILRLIASKEIKIQSLIKELEGVIK